MEPLEIRLSEFEVWALFGIILIAFEHCETATDRQKPHISLESIVLAEQYFTWRKVCDRLPYKKKAKKSPLYKIPVSVAQIMHCRLQHRPANAANQWLLQNLDLALLNRSLKPASTEISI